MDGFALLLSSGIKRFHGRIEFRSDFIFRTSERQRTSQAKQRKDQHSVVLQGVSTVLPDSLPISTRFDG